METCNNSSSAASSLLWDLIPGENMGGGGEEEEESLEWLSIYVEDCLSGATTYTTFDNPAPTSKPPQPPKNPKPSFETLAVPSKARTKRRRVTTPTSLSPDTLLLHHQSYWLAESELIILPRKEEDKDKTTATAVAGTGGGEEKVQQPRRCSHCLSQKTPQWRAGPLGPKTLCNACGVRFKSGRLLPEYRPAKSPSFVSYKHSNSHKKVMEMRMALLPSNSS
ncbi:GATA transcription factor 12-like [Canna indica]|uniref:GATA transcription factor 12-like n=1 Tax=Canna indica TaxID=4628 RepID=A0AAQ3L2Z6_9LILI|nr:GATA transcription factor 12-like [Canna indica]